MDESRKAFELWVASTTNSDLHRGIMLDRRESGGYSHLATENKWEAWQASRAAVALDMPEPFKLAKSSSSLTYYYQDEVDAVLSCVGIKVKE